MLTKKSFSCREIARGMVGGTALVCPEQILFYHTEPETGIITEKGHALEGVSIKGKILVFPGGKGSSVVQMDGLYKLSLHGTAPLGFIVQEPDTVLVSTAIIMEVAMVDRAAPDFYETVRSGDKLILDTAAQTITIERGN